MKIVNGYQNAKAVLSRAAGFTLPEPSPRLKESLQSIFGTIEPDEAVRKILKAVKERGDTALQEYAALLDHVKMSVLEVPAAEISEASASISPALLEALQKAAEQIRNFHENQHRGILAGAKLMAPGTVIRILQRVGLYIPGGTASYPSSVLMTAIPARAAGVQEVIMATPPGKDGRVPARTLAAAAIAGVNRVFAIGGAQAVAAMAYGTESVPRVDKICGPGNLFVMLAKKQVYGTVDIDGLQGPSEVLIIADEQANPVWCAADMLAQAEHDPLAQAVMVTTSRRVADAVQKEIARKINGLERREIISESLSRRGVIAVVDLIDEAIELANLYAPEHLCLYLKDPADVVARIRNAGCVFFGRHPTVVIGDYVAGPSHALPTSGTARFASPLNITDFVRYMNVVDIDEGMMRDLGPVAQALAEAEGLTAHAQAVREE